jgi:hypothetical protein
MSQITCILTILCVLLLGLLASATGCGEGRSDFAETSETSSDMRQTLEVQPAVYARSTEDRIVPVTVTPRAPTELLPLASAMRLSETLAEFNFDVKILDGLSDVAVERTRLTVHLEKIRGELEIDSAFVGSLESLLLCINRDTTIGLENDCEEDEVLMELAEFRGIAFSTPRYCFNHCCRFDDDPAPDGMLLIRQLCYLEIDDDGRMAVTDLSLGVD